MLDESIHNARNEWTMLLFIYRGNCTRACLYAVKYHPLNRLKPSAALLTCSTIYFFFTIWTPLLHDLFKTDVCTVCTQEFSSVGISTEFNTHTEFKQVETLNRAKGSFVQLFPSESFITFHLKKRNIHSEKGHFLFAVRYNL